MNKKKEFAKYAIKARRISSKVRYMEDSKMSFNLVRELQQKHLELLEQLQLLNVIKVSLISERLAWKMDRSQTFWERDCQIADESHFQNNFRMCRRSFYKLCGFLSKLRKKDTKLRDAIPLEKRVAISLYAMGSSANYRTIGNLFGVGKATVCKILLSFCAEVWKRMAPIYINNFPLQREKVEELVQEFEDLGYPQCMGALDGCHIEIHPGREEATDFFNYKGWYSTVLLALVDARCRFIYVSCGSPGRCNDSRIYQESSLKQQLDQCDILADLKKNISDVDVPVHIIGDSAFRLSEKIMKPYPFQVSQNYQQKCFNYSLSKSRRVVENAFGHLKARFRRIGKGIDHAIKNVNLIILSSCVLHNFLNENNDTGNENWLQALEAAEVNRSYPEYVTMLTDHRNNAEKIRNALSEYLSIRSLNGGGVSGIDSDDGGHDMDVDDNSSGPTLFEMP